jgi:hypothetical protein
MRVLLILSFHIKILITDSSRLFHKKQVNRLMIALLDLSQLLAVYVHVALLLILIMNVLNNYCMILMILFGVYKLQLLRSSLILLP